MSIMGQARGCTRLPIEGLMFDVDLVSSAPMKSDKSCS